MKCDYVWLKTGCACNANIIRNNCELHCCVEEASPNAGFIELERESLVMSSITVFFGEIMKVFVAMVSY